MHPPSVQLPLGLSIPNTWGPHSGYSTQIGGGAGLVSRRPLIATSRSRYTEERSTIWSRFVIYCCCWSSSSSPAARPQAQARTPATSIIILFVCGRRKLCSMVVSLQRRTDKCMSETIGVRPVVSRRRLCVPKTEEGGVRSVLPRCLPPTPPRGSCAQPCPHPPTHPPIAQGYRATTTNACNGGDRRPESTHHHLLLYMRTPNKTTASPHVLEAVNTSLKP